MNLQPQYIYAFKCPFTMHVVYIGKTSNVKIRAHEHTKGTSRLSYWIKAVTSLGKEPICETIDCTYGNIHALERSYIKYYASIGQANHNYVCNQSNHDCWNRGVIRRVDSEPSVLNYKKQLSKEIFDFFGSYLKPDIHNTMSVYALEQILRLLDTRLKPITRTA